MANISLTTVKNQLNLLVSDVSSCASIIKTINNNYISDTEKQWNTPAAATYIDRLCAALNDYINQFNTNYQNGIDSFVDGVNALATNENASLVPKQNLEKIQQLSRNWSSQSDDFNIPEDYSGFTSINLTNNIEGLISTIDLMQSRVDIAVANGLNDKYCTNLKTELNKLKTSAKNVATEYSKDAATAALNQDSNLTTIKSNT